MILVTGPTGSGKTTTLYALIREIHTPEVNVVTIENPIEYQLPGVNQVEVNEKQGLTFASVLRSTLRQDPDVILIGEIRDQETAQIALQAAQTGHLVLSTMHTNDAAGAVARLLDFGVDPHVLGNSLTCVVAQRLLRRICTGCSEPAPPDEDTRRVLRLRPEHQCRRGAGCPQCRHTGYRGRVGVYEIMAVSQSMAKIIETRTGESALRQEARREGTSGLLDDAVRKLDAGETTTDEILRVVQVGEQKPTCSECGHELDAGYVACPSCGQSVRTSCQGCGKPLVASWQACPYCARR
jgi:type II secretory ATPase GspE/PulE/Tfp pilus assembly ATPase PilB-like protein